MPQFTPAYQLALVDGTSIVISIRPFEFHERHALEKATRKLGFANGERKNIKVYLIQNFIDEIPASQPCKIIVTRGNLDLEKFEVERSRKFGRCSVYISKEELTAFIVKPIL